MLTENVAVANAYIGEMEELIVCVLGEKSPQEIADFSGVSLEKAVELCMVREMARLNHLLQLRREQMSVPSAQVCELNPLVSNFSVATPMVVNG